MSDEKKVGKEAILNDFAALSLEDQRLVAAEIVRLMLARDGWPWLAQTMSGRGWCGPDYAPCWPRGSRRWDW